jgi:hypothetical protein
VNTLIHPMMALGRAGVRMQRNEGPREGASAPRSMMRSEREKVMSTSNRMTPDT